MKQKEMLRENSQNPPALAGGYFKNSSKTYIQAMKSVLTAIYRHC